MRILFLSCALLSLALPSFAQQQMQHKHDPDPDQMVRDGGVFPQGYTARTDKPDASMKMIRFVKEGQGYHVTTGPATILFDEKNVGSGAYTLGATFVQLKAAAHPEAYGLIIGGSDLAGPAQRYTYFIVRQDGKFMLKRRNGAETSNLVDWTENAAVKKADAQGKITNALSIESDGNNLRFLVNGTEVAKYPQAQVDANGVVGLRVNHNLDVQVDNFSLQAKAKS